MNAFDYVFLFVAVGVFVLSFVAILNLELRMNQLEKELKQLRFELEVEWEDL